MPQTTIYDLLSQMTPILQKKEDAGAIPLKKLLAFWVGVTGLEWTDVVDHSATEIWAQLSTVYHGLRDYLTVMGPNGDPEQLHEAACRMIGKFVLRGASTDEEGYFQGEIPISFDQNAWVYYSDPKLRMRNSKPTFREAVHEVRKLLASTDG